MYYSNAFQKNAPERNLNILFEILDHFTYSFKTSLMAQTYFLSQLSLKTCIIFPFPPDGLKYLFIYLFNRADSSSWVLFFFYLWTKIINGLTAFCLFVCLIIYEDVQIVNLHCLLLKVPGCSVDIRGLLLWQLALRWGFQHVFQRRWQRGKTKVRMQRVHSIQ